MNRIILSIFRKEITHILRDPQSLAMVLLMPILMLVLYGYAITLDMKGITTAIIDESRTTESRSLVQRLSGIDAFHITARDLPLDAIDGLFKSQAARCVLVIPSDYASKLVAKGGTEVELIIDASDPMYARISPLLAVLHRTPAAVAVNVSNCTDDVVCIFACSASGIPYVAPQQCSLSSDDICVCESYCATLNNATGERFAPTVRSIAHRLISILYVTAAVGQLWELFRFVVLL